MSYRNIVVHLANDAGHGLRLAFAIDLAKRFDAHLTALFLVLPEHMPAEITGRGASIGYMAAARDAARENAAMLEHEYKDALAKAGIKGEWQVDEGEHLATLSRYAHNADLVIVGQTTPNHFGDWLTLSLPEHLPMVAGCPVLLVPQSGLRGGGLGRRILIAWKDSRHSIQAVRDALPLLHAAQEILVLGIGEPDKEEPELDRAIAYLDNHGIHAVPEIVTGAHGNVGEIILDRAESENSDLIVMGCYGHSRLREFVLGGVTHYMFHHLSVPVLMSH